MALFIGADWPPNIEAARTLVSLAAELADRPFQFVIAGSVGKALARDPRPASVRVTGPVDDMRPWLEAADLALNPMCSGGGSNIKVLEYLACGLPVISTAFGVRGLGLRVDRDALIVPLAQFGSVLRALVDAGGDEVRARLERSGRKVVEARFDWASIVRGIDAALQGCIAKR